MCGAEVWCVGRRGGARVRRGSAGGDGRGVLGSGVGGGSGVASGGGYLRAAGTGRGLAIRATIAAS